MDEEERQLARVDRAAPAARFTSGVAANLVGLAYLSLAKGDQHQAELHARDAIDTAARWAR
ncbi:hypothetical protein GCM10023317_60210 [Actinopolymorpha pittospori]